MPSRVKPRVSSRTVYTGLPIHWQSAIRHFPESGILPKTVEARSAVVVHATQPNLP